MLCCFAFVTHGYSQMTSLEQKLDAYLLSANTTFRFNGVALVRHKGEIVFQKGYGYANAALKLPNRTTTKFPILSITKAFTALIILKLQEQGKLSVDHSLTKYFPEYPRFKKVKLHHLLTHSSGLHNYTSDVGLEDSAIIGNTVSKEKVLQQFMPKPLEFEPGKRYEYNNSGYFLLGLIIEQVSGKSYETNVREMVFGPLGMKDSGFDFLSLPKTQKAQGYYQWNERGRIIVSHYDSTYGYSAGSIYSTVQDMGIFAAAIEEKKMVDANTWEIIFKDHINNYGYGWQRGTFLEKNYVKHSGGYPGFMSEFMYYPDEDLFIILLNNFGNYDQNIFSVAMGISCIMLDKPYDHWRELKKVRVDTRILKHYVGNYGHAKVYLQGDQLRMAVGRGLDLPLYADSDSTFQFESFNTRFEFEKNGQGQVTGIKIREHGQDSRLKRK